MSVDRHDHDKGSPATAEGASRSGLVFAELFALNFRDELPPGTVPTNREVHAAFVRALHATVCDMPAVVDAERQPRPEPEVAAPQSTRRSGLTAQLGIGAKAAMLALLLRLVLFLATGY